MELRGVVIHVSHLDVDRPFDHLWSQGQQQGVSFRCGFRAYSQPEAMFLGFGPEGDPSLPPGAAVPHTPCSPLPVPQSMK